jgi:predicted lipoprotein with Yx(FWY)xxD motif
VGVLSCLAALSAISAALASGNMVIRSTNNRNLGATILEGPARYTLYVFCVGTQQSRCSGGSSSSFSPLIARGRLVAAAHSGVRARKLGTRKISGGRRQVTYYGQPLYLFKGDRKPRQTHGEERSNSKGVWLVVSTGGRPTPRSGY